VEALFIVLQHLFAYSVTDYMPCLRGLDLDGHERILKNACQTARKYHDPIIEDRIQMWKYGKKKNKEDLLDVLISLKDAHNNALLSKQEIKSIVMVCIPVSFPFHFSLVRKNILPSITIEKNRFLIHWKIDVSSQ
jgi:phenylalanine N-monooxygenase